MDAETNEGPPLCNICKTVPLTPEEELLGTNCYWCAVDSFRQLNLLSKSMQYPLPEPERYGRSSEDIDPRKKSKSLETKSTAGTKLKNSETKAGLPLTAEQRAEFLLKYGFDICEKHITTLIASTDVDTRLILEIPEKINPQIEEYIQEGLDTLLNKILRILTFGPHMGDFNSIMSGDQSKGDPYK